VEKTDGPKKHDRPSTELGTVVERPSRPSSSKRSKDTEPEKPFHDATTHPAKHHSPVSPRIAPEAASERESQVPTLDTIERGNYEVFGEIARGGLGRILRARDKRLDREVAIKELHYRLGNVEARFGREMRLTARLQHPSIVPIYEAGRWPSGEPFYAMKLVAGRSLADVAEDAESIEERLRLLPNIVDVAEAIAYAHSERILHRDLKPANVLVGPFGETVLIDWGLAKDLEHDHPLTEEELPQPDDHLDDILDASEMSFATGSGAVIGTPAFMPPEQARGEAVDERADVYSLGALLYHVLAGVRPYDGIRRGKLLDAVVREPPEPIDELAPEIPPDLVAIIEKAMAREPVDRYPTAAELVEDLQAFSAGKLVASYEYTIGELVRRFVERQKAAIVTAALGICALAAVGVWAFVSISDQRDRAQASATEAREARDLEAEARHLAEDRIELLNLEKATSMLETDPTGAIAWLKELGTPLPGAPTVAIDAADRGVARQTLRGHTDRIWTASFSPDGTLLATGSSDNTVRVWTLGTNSATRLGGHHARVVAVAFSPDGAHLASVGHDGEVCVYDAEGTQNVDCDSSHRGAANALAWSPDSATLATIGADESIRIRSATSSEPRAVLHAKTDRNPRVRFTPDGTRLVSGSHDGALYVWDVARGEQTLVLSGHEGPVTFFDISPDGSTVVSASEDATVRLWDLATGEGRLLGMHTAEVSVAVFDATGQRVASAGLDHRVVVWEVAGGVAVELEGHAERITRLAFHPTSNRLASGSWDRTVHLWDLSSGEAQVLRGHGDVVSWVGFSPDGDTLASASWDGELRVWPAEPNGSRVVGQHEIGIHTVAVSPDGSLIASGGHDDKVILWTLMGDGERMRLLGQHSDHVYRVRFSPDGAWVASSSDDRTVRLFATGSDESHVLRGHEADVEEIAFSPDGRHLASAGEDNRVFLWDVETRAGTPLEGHEQPVTSVVFSPDGALLASASRDRTVRLWNVEDGSPGRSFEDHALEVWGIAFSPDGSTLASASLDDRVLLWDVATGDRVVLSDELGAARLLAYSPDGAHLAVASSSRHLWLCEVADRRCRELEGHATTVTHLFFSDDGLALITTSGDGTIRAWDTATHESRVYRGHRAAVFEADLTPDGAWLVSGSADTTVRRWRFGLPPRPDELPTFLEALSTASLSAGGPRTGSVR